MHPEHGLVYARPEGVEFMYCVKDTIPLAYENPWAINTMDWDYTKTLKDEAEIIDWFKRQTNRVKDPAEIDVAGILIRIELDREFTEDDFDPDTHIVTIDEFTRSVVFGSGPLTGETLGINAYSGSDIGFLTVYDWQNEYE